MFHPLQCDWTSPKRTGCRELHIPTEKANKSCISWSVAVGCGTHLTRRCIPGEFWFKEDISTSRDESAGVNLFYEIGIYQSLCVVQGQFAFNTTNQETHLSAPLKYDAGDHGDGASDRLLERRYTGCHKSSYSIEIKRNLCLNDGMTHRRRRISN